MAVTEPADGPSKDSTGGDKKMRRKKRKTKGTSARNEENARRIPKQVLLGHIKKLT